MVDLLIDNLSDEVIARLAAHAADRGLSLENFLREFIEEYARQKAPPIQTDALRPIDAQRRRHTLSA